MQALKRFWAQDEPHALKPSTVESKSPRPTEGGSGEAHRDAPAAATDDFVLRPSIDCAGLPGAENIVRPAHFQRAVPATSPHRERPELATALDAVMRATDLIKEAETKADQKAQRATDLAFRTFAQLERAEAQIEAAHKLVTDCQGQVRDANRRATEAAKAADTQALAAKQRVGAMEAQIADLTELLEESRSIIEDANRRVAAADARAQEARDDVTYIASQIRQHFALS